MISLPVVRTFFATLSLLALIPSASAAVDCNKDLDACVRLVVAETATFIEECGSAYPRSKAELDSAFMSWSVLKLPIPRINEALDPKSEMRTALSKTIALYLKKIPNYEREIECVGRLEMLQSSTPKLQGDSAKLPLNALHKYLK